MQLNDNHHFAEPVLRAVDRGDDDRPGKAGDPSHEASRKNASLRIAVVEDEPFVRMDIEATLQAAGHEVVGSADSADGAVRLAESKRPDLLIMDIRLIGVRDGVDAAIEIWDRFAIRSLFASANLDPVTRARASRANPIGFLDKPFISSRLLTALPQKTDSEL